MSADNWRVCPACKVRHAESIKARDVRVSKAYGKVTASEWDRMRAERDSAAAKRLDENFREDYEIGVSDDGTFSVDYHGKCQDCGLTFTFKHEALVEMPSAAPR